MKQRTGTFFLIVALLIGVASIGFSALNSGGGGAFASVPDASKSDVGGQGSEKVIVAQGLHVGSGDSDWVCDNGQFTEWVSEVTLQGTMTGTNPTLNISMQHSIDHGTTVAGTVNSFAAINATTVPAVMTDSRIDGVVIANTPVTYGRCWRAHWVAVATGTASANFGVEQYRH